MITDATIVTILVDDQDDALAFYRDVLGFEVRDDVEMEGGDRWVTVAPSGDADTKLTLVEADTDAKRERVGDQVGDHVAVVFETDDCRETYETFRERGVAFHDEPTEVPWGVEAVFEDLYGNVFDLVEPRPME